MIAKRGYLHNIFGNSVQVQIVDTLCHLILEEQESNQIIWINLSQLAQKSKVAKSSVKRIIENLINHDLIEQKIIQTHAQTPPREIRLNLNNPVIKELLFFYRKVRGFL